MHIPGKKELRMSLNKKYFIFKIRNKIKFLFLTPLAYAKSIGVKVGSNTIIMTKIFCTEPYLISIGSNCEITAGVNFITHDGGVWVVRNMYEKYKYIDIIKPIKLNNNIHICNNTIILPGVEIVDDVIVGAGSIVAKDIFKSGVYAGIPARFICTIEIFVYKNKKHFSNTKQLRYFDKKDYYNEFSNK